MKSGPFADLSRIRATSSDHDSKDVPSFRTIESSIIMDQESHSYGSRIVSHKAIVPVSDSDGSKNPPVIMKIEDVEKMMEQTFLESNEKEE